MRSSEVQGHGVGRQPGMVNLRGIPPTRGPRRLAALLWKAMVQKLLRVSGCNFCESELVRLHMRQCWKQEEAQRDMPVCRHCGAVLRAARYLPV